MEYYRRPVVLPVNERSFSGTPLLAQRAAARRRQRLADLAVEQSNEESETTETTETENTSKE